MLTTKMAKFYEKLYKIQSLQAGPPSFLFLQLFYGENHV